MVYTEYKKIQKRTAEKLYNANKEILIIPNKTNPNNLWNLGLKISKSEQIKHFEEYETFNKLLNSFCHYNCNDAQTGLNPAFYVEVV